MKIRKSIKLTGILLTTLVFSIAISLNNETKAQGFNIEVFPAKSNLTIEPGESLDYTYTVRNHSGSEKTLFLYVQDFTVINEQGTPNFIEYDNLSEDARRFALSQWISVPTDQITLADDESAEIELSINVPEDAEAGGHYGAFFVQTENPSQVEGSAIGSIGRIASLMLINVPGDIEEDINITSAATGKQVYWEENPTVEFITYLKNEGSVHGIPVGAFSISGGYGSKTKSVIYNQKQGAVLPGAPERKISETFKLEKDGLVPPIGKFTIELVARYGTNNLPLETTVYFWLLPAKFIAISVLTAIVAGFILWRALVSFKKK